MKVTAAVIPRSATFAVQQIVIVSVSLVRVIFWTLGSVDDVRGGVVLVSPYRKVTVYKISQFYQVVDLKENKLTIRYTIVGLFYFIYHSLQEILLIVTVFPAKKCLTMIMHHVWKIHKQSFSTFQETYVPFEINFQFINSYREIPIPVLYRHINFPRHI